MSLPSLENLITIRRTPSRWFNGNNDKAVDVPSVNIICVFFPCSKVVVGGYFNGCECVLHLRQDVPHEPNIVTRYIHPWDSEAQDTCKPDKRQLGAG